ncbi:MAG: hypothetical protein IJZ57_08995 [Clostridia bacterium]|nr:hypothetical protein [Clostridia bacterium]
MVIVFILIAIVLIMVVVNYLSKPKNDVKTNIEKLKDLSVDELDKILSGTAMAILLHHENVKSVGREQADRVCKYEKYGCNNYAEVKMFHEAVRAERDRKKNNR